MIFLQSLSNGYLFFNEYIKKGEIMIVISMILLQEPCRLHTQQQHIIAIIFMFIVKHKDVLYMIITQKYETRGVKP